MASCDKTREGPDIPATINYYDRTNYAERNNLVPMCCGASMIAEDDHGRYFCPVCGYRTG